MPRKSKSEIAILTAALARATEAFNALAMVLVHKVEGIAASAKTEALDDVLPTTDELQAEWDKELRGTEYVFRTGDRSTAAAPAPKCDCVAVLRNSAGPTVDGTRRAWCDIAADYLECRTRVLR